LTLTGGEPFEQRAGVAALLRLVRRETNLSVVVFTGYALDELRAFPETDELLGLVDVVLAGRYDPRRNGSIWRGEGHKTIYFLSERYSPADLASTAEAEVIVAEDGRVTISGIDPPVW
jgi:anaerobic ribonucleoside-triphosphate reductase activating protein